MLKLKFLSRADFNATATPQDKARQGKAREDIERNRKTQYHITSRRVTSLFILLRRITISNKLQY